jgi:hypothetical protein
MKLEVGAWNKLPHYSVQGSPQNFYVWVNEDGKGSNTSWFKGAEAFSVYNKLRGLSRSLLVKELKRIHSEGTL